MQGVAQGQLVILTFLEREKCPLLQLNWPLLTTVCEDFVQNFMKIRQNIQSLILCHRRADVGFTSGIISLLRAEGLITKIKAHNVAEQLGPSFYPAACSIRCYMRRSIYNPERCRECLPHITKGWVN